MCRTEYNDMFKLLAFKVSEQVEKQTEIFWNLCIIQQYKVILMFCKKFKINHTN